MHILQNSLEWHLIECADGNSKDRKVICKRPDEDIESSSFEKVFIYLTDRKRERDLYSICWVSPQRSVRARAGPGQTGKQECSSCFLGQSRGPIYTNHHLLFPRKRGLVTGLGLGVGAPEWLLNCCNKCLLQGQRLGVRRDTSATPGSRGGRLLKFKTNWKHGWDFPMKPCRLSTGAQFNP